MFGYVNSSDMSRVVLTHLTEENGCSKEKMIHWKYWECSEACSAEWKSDVWMKRWVYIVAELSDEFILARHID